MAKVVLICPKPGTANPYDAATVERLARRLAPDIITPRPPLVSEPHGVLTALLNPIAGLPMRDGAICLGMLLDPREDWPQPGADAPDGSYALFRVDSDSVELVTDIVASRNIWYAQTDGLFIASSSQRALVCLLQSFEPNRATFSWMFSSGTIGPGLSWDRRIRQAPPDGRVRLDRGSWQVTETREPAILEPADRSEEGHRQVLHDAMEETFRHFHIDCSHWVLPLSGGADSRAIMLYMLRNDLRPRCVTWGIAASMGQPGNDATIARDLAAHFDLEHRYLTTDITSDEPPETILDRFIRAAEGATDLIEPYMDGFKLWKRFFDDGTVGQIRGDELFGHRGVAAPADMRAQCWCQVLTDYPNLAPLTALGIERQEMPERLRRRRGESLSTWKDRTFQTYTEPGVLAGMNEIMCQYIEVVNPLVARRIVHEIRTLPDRLRDFKRAYREVILSIGPPMEWASEVALAKTIDLMTQRPMVEEFRSKLDTRAARDLLSDELIDLVLGRLVVAEGGPPPSRVGAARGLARKVLPAMLRKWLRSTLWKPHLSWNVVAHRAYTIWKMNELLEEDAAALSDAAR